MLIILQFIKIVIHNTQLLAWGRTGLAMTSQTSKCMLEKYITTVNLFYNYNNVLYVSAEKKDCLDPSEAQIWVTW